MDVITGLTRLNAHLPLAERQAALPEDLRRMHRAILRSFAELGRPPEAGDLGITREEFERDLVHLAQRDLVVIDVQKRVTGAYPFTLEDTPHRVVVAGHEVRAMCSLDAVAIAPMFAETTVIESLCAVTGDPIRITMTDTVVVEVDPPTPFVGIGFQETHGCAATSLCRDMVFLRDREAALEWQGDAGEAAPIFGLDAALDLGKRFFGPLVGAETAASVRFGSQQQLCDRPEQQRPHQEYRHHQ